MQTNESNILSVLKKATAQEVAEGMNWYKDARAYCKTNSKKYNISVDVVIACLSALSPRNKWANNLRDTVIVLDAVANGLNPEDVRVCTFNRNKEKAFAIVREGKPSLVKMSNKTAAFFDNIKYASSEAVTVDMHAYSIFYGEPKEVKAMRDKEYTMIANAYRNAANSEGIRPYEVQAITWVTFRRMIKTKEVLPLAA